MQNHLCIWCLEHAEGTHEEHIIPEALGCPSGFILPGTAVCRKCNNGYSDLDQAVIDEFDFLTFMAGVPKKRGRPPAIRSRGNVLATVEPNGPTFTFNMDPAPVTAHDGKRLAPYRGSPRDIRANLKTEGQAISINFQVPFGQSKKFVRGVTKIAFSSLAFFLGAPLARSSAFSPIRSFVRNGKGSRHVMIAFDSDTTYSNRVWAPFVSPSGEYVVTFRLACVEFVVDLSKEESFLDTFQSSASCALRDMEWCTLPAKT